MSMIYHRTLGYIHDRRHHPKLLSCSFHSAANLSATPVGISGRTGGLVLDTIWDWRCTVLLRGSVNRRKNDGGEGGGNGGSGFSVSR